MIILFKLPFVENEFRINDTISFGELLSVESDNEPYQITIKDDDLIKYLYNDFKVVKISDDAVFINRLAEINSKNGTFNIKGSCINKTKVPDIKINIGIIVK